MPAPIKCCRRLLPHSQHKAVLATMGAEVKQATVTAPVTPDTNMRPHGTNTSRHRGSHQKKNLPMQDPSSLMRCFPSSFLPFLRSFMYRRDNAFDSFLSYWSDPQNVKYTRNTATVQFSFGAALDRALQGDWEMASAFLLNGAFIEQCQRCGGLENVADFCLNSSDGRDRRKLFGLYFGALRALKSQNTLLHYLEQKVDKKQLAIVRTRNDMRSKKRIVSSKQRSLENEPDSSSTSTPPSAPVSIVICYQEQASNYVEDEHEFAVSPNQEIRLVFVEYAKTVRKVPLRSLRFSFPIHLPELEGMNKTAAEHLTFEGLGLDGNRIKVFCTAADSVEPPSDMPSEVKTPMATSTPATPDVPEISPLSTLLTPDRPEPTFVERRVKYSHPLITAVNSQQVMTAPAPKHRALISPGTPHTPTDTSSSCIKGIVEASSFPSYIDVGLPIMQVDSYDSAQDVPRKPQNIHRPRRHLDSLCMLSDVATALATH